MIDKVISFIEDASDAVLPARVGECFAELAQQFGFTNTLIIDAAAIRDHAATAVVFSRLRSNVMDFYAARPVSTDPLVQCATAVDAPFDVERARAILGYREADLRKALFPPVRDKHIVVLPVHRYGKPMLFAGCAGDKPEDSPHVRAFLHASLHAAYDLIRALAPNRELTPREAACLQLIAAGNTYKGVGEILDLRERTVRAAVASAKHKLHARTKAEAVAMAVAAVRRIPPAA